MNKLTIFNYYKHNYIFYVISFLMILFNLKYNMIRYYLMKLINILQIKQYNNFKVNI